MPTPKRATGCSHRLPNVSARHVPDRGHSRLDDGNGVTNGKQCSWSPRCCVLRKDAWNNCWAQGLMRNIIPINGQWLTRPNPVHVRVMCLDLGFHVLALLIVHGREWKRSIKSILVRLQVGGRHGWALAVLGQGNSDPRR